MFNLLYLFFCLGLFSIYLKKKFKINKKNNITLIVSYVAISKYIKTII